MKKKRTKENIKKTKQLNIRSRNERLDRENE